MSKKLLTVAAMLLMSASALLMTSCQKWGNDPITPQPEPKQEMITQSFGMKLVTDLRQMDANLTGTKSWNSTATNLDGLLVYSDSPATLTLTGTDNTRVYTQPNVTIAQLQAGITFSILPGTYTATYLTEHIRTTDVFSAHGMGNAEFQNTWTPQIADKLDIKIDQPGLHITGTPINLQATPEDALVIVDIPNVNEVKANTSIDFAGVSPYLLFNAANSYHWGYLNQTPMWLRFMAPTEKTVDASGYLKGNVYHLISAFEGTTKLDVTPMNINEVEVPN